MIVSLQFRSNRVEESFLGNLVLQPSTPPFVHSSCSLGGLALGGLALGGLAVGGLALGGLALGGLAFGGLALKGLALGGLGGLFRGLGCTECKRGTELL